MAKVKRFSTGATRSSETTFDPSGFLSPAVLAGFCRYMEKHRKQADGTLRAADNWQKGMPTSRAYRSLTRHFFDLWLLSRGYAPASADCKVPEDALHAVLFNVFVILKNRIDGNDHEEGGRPSSSAGRWLEGVMRSQGAFLIPQMAAEVQRQLRKTVVVRKLPRRRRK